jgi:hypothetical protein
MRIQQVVAAFIFKINILFLALRVAFMPRAFTGGLASSIFKVDWRRI